MESRYCYPDSHTLFAWLVSFKLIANFTAQSSYDSAVLRIAILSVYPSVTHVLYDEMIESTADILIPYERTITLVF